MARMMRTTAATADTRTLPARPRPGDRGTGRRRARARTLALALTLGAVACAAPANAPEAPAPGPGPTPAPSPSDAPRVPEPAPIEPGLAPDRIGPYALGIDVLRYDFEIGLSDRSQEFAGRAVIDVRVTGADVRLPLDFTGLAVDEVTVDGRRADIHYENGVLTVDLPMLAAGGDGQVTVTWHGTPDDGLFIGPHVHGAPSAFADNWPNRTRFWLPTVDHPSDKALVRYTVHAPAAWDVVANGYLTADPTPTPAGALGPASGPRRTWIWDTVRPIPTYTMVIGAAEMVGESVGRAACGQAPASQEPDGCVDVGWMAFAPDAANARAVFARAARMVDYYTDLIGPYPYEKLQNVQSGTRFGGMENSSAIFYSGQGIAQGTMSEGTVAHEIAHQWFGDSVTETEWSHLWLSEGFATYFGALFFEAEDGVADFRRRMEEARQRYLSSDDVDRPVVAEYPNLFQLLNRNSYQKGGWVLHMLRGVMGDDAFYDGIRRYYTRYEHGNALTADFQAVMEEVHGASLDWFFRQWIFEPGYPSFAVSWAWIPGQGDGGQVELTVRQVQKAAWPRFRMPATVALVGVGDDDRRRIDIDAAAETVVRVEAPRRPERVVLDPDGWILTGAVDYR